MSQEIEITGGNKSLKELDGIISKLEKIVNSIGEVNGKALKLSGVADFNKQFKDGAEKTKELESALADLTDKYDKLSESRVRASKALSEEDKLKKSNIRLTEQLSLSKQKEYKTNILLRQEKTRTNKEIRNEISSYGQLTNAINEDTLAIQNLMAKKTQLSSLDQMELSLAKERLRSNLKIKSSIYAQTQTLATLGQQTKSYSGVAGALVNELGRGIQDIPFGLKGIANNLSQIGSLWALNVQQAGGFKGAIKDVGKAMKGGLGVLVAFNVALTFFQSDWFKGFVNGSKAIKQLENAFFRLISLKGGIRDLKEVLEDATSNASKSAGRFKVLTDAVTDTSKSTTEHNKILKQIKKEYPDFNTEVLNDAKNHGLAKEAIKKYTHQLAEKGLAIAIATKQTKAYNEIARLELEQEEVAFDRRKTISDAELKIEEKKKQLEQATEERAKGRIKSELNALKSLLKEKKSSIDNFNREEIEEQERVIERLSDIAKRRNLSLPIDDEDDKSGGGSSKNTRFKNFEESETERLELLIKINKGIIDSEKSTKEERDRLALENVGFMKRINDIEKANSLDRLKDELKFTELKGKNKKELEEKVNAQISEAKIKHSSNLIDIDDYEKDQLTNNAKAYFEEQKKLIANNLLENTSALAERATDNEKFWSKLTTLERENKDNSNRYNKEKRDIAIKLTEEQIKAQKELIELSGDSEFVDENSFLKLVAELDKLKKKLAEIKEAGEDLNKENPFEKYSELINATLELLYSLADLSNAFTERRLQEIEKETEALEEAHERKMEMLEEYYDAQQEALEESTEDSLQANALLDQSAIDAALNADLIRDSSAKKKKALEEEQKLAEEKAIEEKEKREEELQAKKQALQIRQAKFDKAVDLMAAITGTAQSVASAPTLGLKILHGVIGAAQIATIAATPIPAFADGGEMGHNGLMLVNDGGQQEYIERDGKIFTTTKENAVVEGKKGDVIYKSYQDMIDQNIMAKASKAFHYMGNENKLDISPLRDVITDEIRKGFKHSNNTINITNKVSGESYRNRLNQ